MSKGNNLQSLFCGILFCISVTALIIACLAFTKKGGGEYYEEGVATPPRCPAPTPGPVGSCPNYSATRVFAKDPPPGVALG